MAVVIPTGCGGEGDDEPKKPEPTVSAIAPKISLLQPMICVFWGAKVEQVDSSLLIGSVKVAEWKAGSGKIKSVELSLNGIAVSMGIVLNEKGILSLTVTNDADKSANSSIKLTDEVMIGLSSLNGVLQVDKEVNLIENLTFAKGFELAKTEIESDGQRKEIADPTHFIPEYPGSCTLFFSVKKNETTSEVRADNLTIKPLEYKSIEIRNIKPKEILPIVWQVNSGDKKVYEHIEHLRIAEATRIRDMMWEYGAGNYSPEEYQQLMMRLNTGISGETPYWYDNYEIIDIPGIPSYPQPSYHARNERNILNTLINHANFKVANPWNRYLPLYNLAKNNKNSINIFWKSTSRESDSYLEQDNEIIELLELKNFIIFWAGTNINKWKDWILKNKIYQKDININDEHWIYGLVSTANWENDNIIDRHLLVTVWTNAAWDTNQTNETYWVSRFPVWFHDKILFSWRAFPYLTELNNILWESWKYASSYTNYVNVAMADICFQMKADTPDADKLLEMIRSTSLTDYISLDWQTQPLQLINPAGFFLKYLMPLDLPISVGWSQTAALSKGYYHGLVFNIPGAEVKVNGEWIRCNADNKDLILAQNPFTLEWRLNGDLLRKLGYKQGDTVKGKVIAIDDQWNGLNLSQDISISVSAPDGINAPHAEATSDTKLFNLNGHPVGNGNKGIVIGNGRKTITK